MIEIIFDQIMFFVYSKVIQRVYIYIDTRNSSLLKEENNSKF